MVKINNKSFIKYRKGLANSQEKQEVLASEESKKMLWMQWENPTEMESIAETPEVESMLKSVHLQLNKTRRIRAKLMKVAAAIFIPLVLGLGWYYVGNPQRIQSMQTANGEIETLELPDNSQVALNVASELKYPKKFSDSKREVYLKGEAFFKVQHNAQKPFIVHLDELQVEVLGTSFNCSAYTNDRETKVSLIEGKVAIHFQGKDEILLPGEELVLDKEAGTLIKKNCNTNDVLAWQEGSIVFYNAGFGEISRRLSRYFDYNIKVEQGLEEHHFTLTLKNESIEEALELLKLTAPIDYTINQKQVTIMNKRNTKP